MPTESRRGVGIHQLAGSEGTLMNFGAEMFKWSNIREYSIKGSGERVGPRLGRGDFRRFVGPCRELFSP